MRATQRDFRAQRTAQASRVVCACCRFCDRKEYAGQYEGNVKVGHGRLRLANGAVHCGGYRDNAPHGYGEKAWPPDKTGEGAKKVKYEGQFEKGVICGCASPFPTILALALPTTPWCLTLSNAPGCCLLYTSPSPRD